MIIQDDQISLLKLISNYLKQDTRCFAFGDTAMMFYGYKDTTKDIDLLFDKKEDYDEFIRILLKLGYKRTNPMGLYPKNRENKPVMYTKGDERFDLFYGCIFRTKFIEDLKKDFFSREDFVGNKGTFYLNVVRKEVIVLLKALTNREKDFADVLKILENDDVDWDFIVNTAVKLKQQGDDWILIDLEEFMTKLKSKFFIKKKYFDMLYLD